MFYVEQEERRAARQGRTRFHYPCRLCGKEMARARRKPRLDYVDALKLERGCADCGIRSDHPEIYDFDHLPGTEKKANIATLVTRGPWDALLAEIAKCEVVCANCHRIRSKGRPHKAFGKSRGAQPRGAQAS